MNGNGYHDTRYPILRESLAPGYASWSDAALARALGDAVPIEYLEDFGSFLRSAGSALNQYGPAALAGAGQGAATGAALGPWGALIGAGLGAATSLMSRPSGPAPVAGPTPAPGPTAPAASGGAGGVIQTVAGALPGLASAAGVSPSAVQLLGLLGRPEVVQALTALAMGRMGRATVPAGAAQVPVTAVAEALRELADQVLEDYRGASAGWSADVPAYLRAPDGRVWVDPANPRERANMVLYHLAQSESWAPTESEEALGEFADDAEYAEDYD